METRDLSPVEVQASGCISKHIFTKINRDPVKYQPGKETAFQFCVALQLNLDESMDLLARAGFVFSPSKFEDVIWKSGIENGWDIYDISDALEACGFPPVSDF